MSVGSSHMIPASTSKEKPITPADKRLSEKHLSQSIKYNLAHARDHIKQEKIAKAKLQALKGKKAGKEVI